MLRLHRRRPACLSAAVLLIMLTFGVLLNACGDDGSSSETTAVSGTVTTAGGVSTTLPTTASTAAAEPGSSSTTSAPQPADSTMSTMPPSSIAQATATTASTVTAATVTTVSALTTSTTKQPTTTTAKPTTTTAAPTTTTAKAPTALQVTGPAGVKELSMADLTALPATSGYGGWKNQFSNITAPASWKGISLPVLMELVGGSGSVTIVASDGYTMSLSAGEAGGSINTYDPATGEPVTGISVKAIVAYAKGGGALGSGEGPLRIAFVSSDANQVTDSDMWVKYVAELRFD